MKSKKSMLFPVCWGIYVLLIVIALLIPAVSEKNSSGSETASLFELFGYGSVLLGYGGYVSYNPFYSILAGCLLFVPAFLSLSQKPTAKYIALGLSFTLFAFLLIYVKNYSKMAEGHSNRYHAYGLILTFIAVIGAVIVSACDIFFNLYYEKLSAFMKENSNKDNTLALMEENRQMLDKGLITKEEYEDRRSKILGE